MKSILVGQASQAVKACSLAALLGCPLQAQLMPARQDEMVWDGAKVVLSHSSTHTFRVYSPGEGPIQEFKAPDSSWDLHYLDGTAYCVAKEPYGTKPDTRVLWMSTNLRNWNRYGSFQDKEAHLIHCYPLADHLFFMIALPSKPFRQGRTVSPFAVGKLNEAGNIEIKELTNLGFPQAILQKIPAKAGETQERFALRPAYEYLHAAILSPTPFVRVDEGFILTADHVGLFWLFDSKGRLRKRIRLFSSVTEERLADRDTLEHAVLGFQPRGDGQVLIASRTESAFLHAREKYPRDESLETMGKADVQKENARQEQKSLAAYPELKWWLLNPEDGSLSEAEPPLKVKDHFDDVAELAKFKYRFIPNGNLRFGEEDPPLPSPTRLEGRTK